MVERSRRVGDDVYSVPLAGRVHAALVDAIGEMLAPLEAAQIDGAPDRDRLRALADQGPEPAATSCEAATSIA